jgi:hypothetical protein
MMAAAEKFRLDPVALASSAAHVIGQGQDLASVGDHATDLNQDGIDFAAMERDAVEKFQALQPTADSSVGLA